MTSPPTTSLRVRFSGRICALTAVDRRALLDRSTSSDPALRSRVASIIERVRRDGDLALRALARELDAVELDALEVPGSVISAALATLDPALRRAMERTIANVERAHRAFLPAATEIETEPGVVVGRRPDPLGRIGVYAPGGRAAYPSSVIMGVVPARVAGVTEIVLCSPPGPSGRPSAAVLAAAALTGADRVFAVGGAGAIAAMALGTDTVPRVDRIVGPGNSYVAEAKLQLTGEVGMDSPAGPSELLLLADESTDPALVARELVAQAEHDPAAFCIAVVVGDAAAARVSDALDAAAASAARRDIVTESLERRGGVLVAHDRDEAVALANEIAAEHVMVATSEPEAWLARLRNAGTVFVGEASSVAFGDYMTGANHVLPTGGLARCYSGLSTADFMRWTSYQRIAPAAARRLAADVGVFADAELLPGHAAAARAWSAR